jgi:hypothetical protein
MEDIREIVIRTDETVKHLKDDFERHEKDGNKKYDILLENANSCVESGHIKEQNGKIDRIIALLDKLQQRNGVTFGDIVKGMVVIATIVGITFGVMSYFNRANGEEKKHNPDCPIVEGMPIDIVVKAFNEADASKAFGFTFSCAAPDIEIPTLQFYTNKPRNFLVAKENTLKCLTEAISTDWQVATGSCLINVYDSEGRLCYYTDKEGNFIAVDDMMI